MRKILRNVRVWDGIADTVDAGIDTVAIVDNRIEAVGAVTDMAPGESQDMGGLTIIPGLIDAHVHLSLDPEERDPLAHGQREDDVIMAQMTERVGQMARAGITSARDLGGGRWLELEIRDRIARGEIIGPRMLCAGQPVTSPEGHCHFWGGEAKSMEDIEAVVQRQLDHGVDLIKVMATGGMMTPKSKPVDSQFDRQQLTAISALAAAAGLHVAAHCHGVQGIGDAAASGVTTIEHCSWVGKRGWGRDFDENIAALMARRGVWVSPTVNLGWKRRIGSGDYERTVQGNFAGLKTQGVRLIASTDAGIPGVRHEDLARALPVFAHFAALTPVETLRAATSDCAAAIGLGQVTGRIEPGFAADLLLVDGDPLTDLDVLAKPVEVCLAGLSLHGVAAILS